jgi:hypothetical protein
VVTIINFSDSSDAHLMVRGHEDGVVVSEGGFGRGQFIFIPDTAVRPMIRALQEIEEAQRGKLQGVLRS